MLFDKYLLWRNSTKKLGTNQARIKVVLFPSVNLRINHPVQPAVVHMCTSHEAYHFSVDCISDIISYYCLSYPELHPLQCNSRVFSLHFGVSIWKLYTSFYFSSGTALLGWVRSSHIFLLVFFFVIALQPQVYPFWNDKWSQICLKW